ncbi:MAG: amidohydrolase family protein [Acidobacteria bacterium]|nr:amidohydrolase family protein [Acidobacteriota bacterium]
MRPITLLERILCAVVSSFGLNSRRDACLIVVLIPTFLLAMTGEVRSSQIAEPPELVLHSGKIVTVDDAFRVVEAVAVLGGRVTAVGRNQDVLPLIGPTTRSIDLQGRTVLPGIIDTHVHLMDYALYHTAPEVAPEVADFRLVEGADTSEILAELQKRIQRDLRAQDDSWLVYEIRPGKYDSSVQFSEQVNRFDLDRLAPNHPLLVEPANARFLLVNSAGLEALKKIFPIQALEAELDSSREPTGRLAMRVRPMLDLVIPPQEHQSLTVERRAELLARAYKKELEEWAGYGVTTWASKLDTVAHTGFSLLDRQGEMPIRLAYSLQGATLAVAEKMGSKIEGTGSPYLWTTGIYGGSADRMCTSLPSPVKDLEQCLLLPGSPRWKAIYAAVRRGFRIGGFHAHGDLGVDHIFQLIEQASQEAGMTIEQIRRKKHALDHCRLNPRPDQIAKGLELGVTWTCGPKYIIRASVISAKRYDDESIARWTVPLKSMITAGLHPAFHTDGHHGGPMLFEYIQMMMTRREMHSGRVWALQEAIDRKDALRSATRWSAEYTLREDELGSIEVGKWADMIIIDRDYLSIPTQEIGRIQVLMTLVGGKIVYQRPEMATALSRATQP